MKNQAKVYILALFMALIMLLSTGCTLTLLGEWEADNGYASIGLPDRIEFKSGGECVADGMPGSYDITWTDGRDGKMWMAVGHDTYDYDICASGACLYLFTDYGIATYHREESALTFPLFIGGGFVILAVLIAVSIKTITEEKNKEEEGKWNCPNCGANNTAESLYCGGCGRKRPEPDLPGGKWRCKNCDTINEDFADFCGICGSPRGYAPDEPRPAPDEPVRPNEGSGVKISNPK